MVEPTNRNLQVRGSQVRVGNPLTQDRSRQVENFGLKVLGMIVKGVGGQSKPRHCTVRGELNK